MADQHNPDTPALTNQVAEDIPDIKESLEFHKDTFERILQTWSDTNNSTQKIDTSVGFNDGTYNYEFPTNGVGVHSVIMLGTSDTIIWMYLNAAPPGWKVLTTGADMVLGVSGGSAAFNVNGGNPDSVATWAISGLTKDAHTHSLSSHTHALGVGAQLATTGDKVHHVSKGGSDALGGYALTGGSTTINALTSTTGTPSTANSGAQSAAGVTSAGTWRPKASIGKLFQLDTA